MKRFSILLILSICFGLASCIQDEAANSECDIEVCRVECADYNNVFYTENEMQKSVSSVDSVISFLIRDNADISALGMHFTITEGARIFALDNGTAAEYVNGTVLDFSNGPLAFRVVSEDKAWHRDYKVRFAPVNQPSEFHFENFELDPKGSYHLWFEYDEVDRRNDMWATGNPGFRLSKSSAKVDEYPSVAVENGYKGYGVKLETRNTGGFGAMVNMRLAAGNLFIGTFDITQALKDAMQATCMGLPYRRKPVTFSGYYHYRPGETYQDRQGKPVNKVDQPDIYAVFYKNTDADGNALVLHGDDVLTHENIVAKAQLQNHVVGDEWKYFEIPFEYTEEVDPELLRSAGYSLAVVCTSSIEGASFCGAIGSTLWVDEINVVSVDL